MFKNIGSINAPLFISTINGDSLIGECEDELVNHEQKRKFTDQEMLQIGNVKCYECSGGRSNTLQSYVIADNAPFHEIEHGVFETHDVFGNKVTFTIEYSISKITMADLNKIIPHSQNVIEISCDHIATLEDVNFNELKQKYAVMYQSGQDLPDGVRVRDVLELINEINEVDPNNYYFPI